MCQVFAFSAENWARGREEVGFLMRLMDRTLSMEVSDLCAKGVRVAFAGDREALPEALRRTLERRVVRDTQCRPSARAGTAVKVMMPHDVVVKKPSGSLCCMMLP